MKVSLTHYEKTYSIEVERDDISTPEAVEMAVNLLIAAGWSHDSVVKAIGELEL